MVSQRLQRIDWSQTPFRDLELIGSGAMGSVTRATDERSGRAVALKLLTDPNPTKQERFLREAQLAARIEHPNVVRVHEVFPLGGGHLLVSELVEGARHLDEAWEELSLEERVDWLSDAARGVGAAHAAGVTHRDLKPANVLVDADGRVRVADFGVAFAADLDRLTQTGAMVGTPHYMSPEQFGGAGKPGPPSDVWALGVMLHLALTDALPFDEPSLGQMAAAIQNGLNSGQRSLLVGAPRQLVGILEQCLQQDPAKRPQNAAEFADLLDEWLANPSGSTYRMGRTALALTLVGSFSVALALLFFLGGEPPEAVADSTPARAKVDVEAERAKALQAGLEEVRQGKIERGLATLDGLRPPLEPSELDGVRGALTEKAVAAFKAGDDPGFEEVCDRLGRIGRRLPPEARGMIEAPIAKAVAQWLCKLSPMPETAYRRVLAALRSNTRLRDRHLGTELCDHFFALALMNVVKAGQKDRWFVLMIRLDAPVPFFDAGKFDPVMRPAEFSEHHDFWSEYLALRGQPRGKPWGVRLNQLVESPAGKAALGPIQWAGSRVRAARYLKDEEALQALQEAVARDPTSPAVFHDTAMFHGLRGSREETRRGAVRCLELMDEQGFENYSITRKAFGRRVNRLAYLLADVGELELAREFARRGEPYKDTQREQLQEKYPELIR